MPRLTIRDWPPYSPTDLQRRELAVLAAKLMMNAALTAPITGGIPQTEGEIVYGEEEQEEIARKVEELAFERESWRQLFRYEAEMAREADAILFVGNTRAHRNPWGGECGTCAGRPDCSFVYSGHPQKRGIIDEGADRKLNKRLWPGPHCTVYAHNLGYNIGSALMVAVRLYVDARPFMSWGLAARKLGYCRNSGLILGVGVDTRAKLEFGDVTADYHIINMRTAIDAVRSHVSQSWVRPALGHDYRALDLEK